MKCQSCGADVPDGAKFCNECGARIAPAISTCASCGAELVEGAKFCNECGTPVGGASAAGSDKSASPSKTSTSAAAGNAHSASRTLTRVLAALALVVGVGILGFVGFQATLPPETPKDSLNITSRISEELDSLSKLELSDEEEPEAAAPSQDGGASSTSGGPTSQDMINSARQFALYFFANHVQAGGPQNDPSPLELSWWKRSCLEFVAPGSGLERAIQNATDSYEDPDSPFLTGAAQCVTDTQVKQTTPSSVTLVVSTMGTQDSWKDALTFENEATLSFDGTGKIYRVETEWVTWPQEGR